MILDEVNEIKTYIRRCERDILNGIDSSPVRNKLERYNEELGRLINSDEYKRALKKEALRKLKETEKIKRTWKCVSISGGKNPMAWSNRRSTYEKESKKIDTNHMKKWTDKDLEIVYSSDIKMEINDDTFFIPISEGKKLKKLWKNVGRRYYAVEAHLRNKETYLNEDDPDSKIRPFYKPRGLITKSGEQIKRVLDKMIKEGKLKFKEDVITSK